MTPKRVEELARVIHDDNATAAEHIDAAGELLNGVFEAVFPPPEPGEPTLREQSAAARGLKPLATFTDPSNVPDRTPRHD